MEKLRAFLEGLEMQNIEELMLITPVELKLIGTVMADEIRVLKRCASEPSVEALQHGKSLANTGNYPVGTSGCFNVGISGGCGPDCFVYLNGDCEEPQEMVERLNASELKRHAKLYS